MVASSSGQGREAPSIATDGREIDEPGDNIISEL
jgi:hypothetical protein